jgi:ferredoxin like protein
MNLNEKLHRVRYRVNRGKPHIRLNLERCTQCAERVCLTLCPVENFFMEAQEVMLKWEDCLECGACRIACPLGALDWDYPDGGFGISYRYG